MRTPGSSRRSLTWCGSIPATGRIPSSTQRPSDCFALALDDAGIPDDEPLRSTLVDWFAWSNRVVNHTYERPELVPDDLTLPHWSWDGPVE
jgi:hypothetical protein